MRFALVVCTLFSTILAKGQIEIYGIDIFKNKFTKKEKKEWEPGPQLGSYKKKVPETSSPFAYVYKYPGNEYHFKTDRGNYENMPDRFRMGFKYLENKFGEPSLFETSQGSLTDLKLKRHPNGTVYFFTHKWDFDAQQYYMDQGDTLTVTEVYNKIISHREWVSIEWGSLQQYGIIVRLKWARSGLRIQTLNLNPNEEIDKLKAKN